MTEKENASVQAAASKKKKIKAFDTSKKPKNPYFFLMPVEWGGTAAYTIPAGGKITKINCEGLKPPYLLLANHASMIDFPMAVKAIFPHKTNWVISIEEFVGREWLFRGVGGIYKRKFTSDIVVVRHMLRVLKQHRHICTMYPEARYSLAGINEQLDGGLGSLVKVAKVPVVVLISHGNFLQSPQWNKKPMRKVPVDATFTQIVTREEAETLTAEEIQRRIEAAFEYDDYRWQRDNNIKITSVKRANNIHRILYKCSSCGKDFTTYSKDTDIWCSECGKRWRMNEYGELHCINGDETFTHVPDWYRWEREEVRREVREGRYRFEDDVRVEHLDNCKIGFRSIGEMKMTHDENGFVIDGMLEEGIKFKFHRSVSSMYSCHIEYDFHGRGDGIDLATLKDTYFVFPLTARNVLTKIHFATEELYKYDAEKKAETKKIPAENTASESDAAGKAAAVN
ncbi:MAG: hypothetical protein MJ137_03870 [Clostridia bacterium]|nr:hypothetical protein [Clostridia bacterium]